MKISRNEPCPCGSGKKYKKCCLPKETQAAAQKINAEKVKAGEQTIERQAAATNAEVEVNEDPIDAKYQQFWKEFKIANFQQKANLIKKAFDAPELMNSEDVFDLFDGLESSSTSIKERQIYQLLVEQLKINFPDLYQDSISHLLSTCVNYALIDEHREKVSTYFTEWAQFADADIDIFGCSLDQLAYYDHLTLLVEAMSIGWQNVEHSSNIVSWGIEEYRYRASEFELLHYLAHAAEPALDDSQLVAKMEQYGEFEPEKMSGYFACITDSCMHAWHKEDFNYSAISQQNSAVSEQDVMENICSLSNEFMSYLYKTKAVPYSRAEMIRTEMKAYLQRRAKGELSPRRDPRKKKPKQKKSFSNAQSILYPDRKTFDRYLGGKMQFLSLQQYRAFALCESIPAWLEFLHTRALIDEVESRKLLDNLAPLYVAMEDLIHTLIPQEVYILEQLHKAWKISGFSHA